MKRAALLTILIIVCEACDSTAKDKIPDCGIRGAVAVLSGIIESFEMHTEKAVYTREELVRILKYDRAGIAALKEGENGTK